MDSKSKLADALRLRDAGRNAEAAAALEALIDEYAGSDTADLAKSYLFNLQNPVESASAVGLDPELEKIVLSTSATIPEGRVVRTLGIITAECAFGMNVFSDFFSSIRDVVGGRSGAWQNALRDARVNCLNELRREARQLGAGAVVSVSLEYSEISGGGRQMLFLVASGTAVAIEPSA